MVFFLNSCLMMELLLYELYCTADWLTFLSCGVLPEHLPDVGGASVQGLAVDLLHVHLQHERLAFYKHSSV